MACNNWDKLAKAQRDYPNPKFANSFVDKSIKKTPKNPFLLVRKSGKAAVVLRLIIEQAWKADLSLQLNQEPKTVVSQLQQAWKQPGLIDSRLLSYIYRLLAEATRRQQDNGLSFSSVGNENKKVWQDAAKALTRKDERKELWSELGRVSLGEECWEDFREVWWCISVHLININANG
jgi:N-terminal acetyltransferase B complex non-catalytic subunit